jgi:hypothetical protein
MYHLIPDVCLFVPKKKKKVVKSLHEDKPGARGKLFYKR